MSVTTLLHSHDELFFKVLTVTPQGFVRRESGGGGKKALEPGDIDKGEVLRLCLVAFKLLSTFKFQRDTCNWTSPDPYASLERPHVQWFTMQKSILIFLPYVRKYRST